MACMDAVIMKHLCEQKMRRASRMGESANRMLHNARKYPAQIPLLCWSKHANISWQGYSSIVFLLGAEIVE